MIISKLVSALPIHYFPEREHGVFLRKRRSNEYETACRTDVRSLSCAKWEHLHLTTFLPKDKSAVDMVRVQMGRIVPGSAPKRLGLDERALLQMREMCDVLHHEFGYAVTANISNVELVTEQDIITIGRIFHDAEYLSFIWPDTFGACSPNQYVSITSRLYKSIGNINIGCHAHNNTNEALTKKNLAMINHGCTIVDTCVHGLDEAEEIAELNCLSLNFLSENTYGTVFKLGRVPRQIPPGRITNIYRRNRSDVWCAP